MLQMKHNMDKNPNWREANQLAIYKRSRRILQLGTAVKQIHEVLRVGFEPGTYGLEVQHPNSSATLPPVNMLCVSTCRHGKKKFS